MSEPANNINHVVLVIDESWSMAKHRAILLKIVKRQIERLAQRSTELEQETRVSIYTFDDTTRCRVYDKDVLRLPSIADLYNPDGRTALIDATITSLDELAQTAQLHGDHAFLVIVLTDGGENQSRLRPLNLRDKIAGLPDHWTVAGMVPDALGKDEAQAFGFPPGNITIWDASSTAGFEEAGSIMAQATDDFLTGRARGVRSTKTLFSTGAEAVNDTTVKSMLAPLSSSAYQVLTVGDEDYIRPFVESRGLTYSVGQGYYQLTKKEMIQRRKKIVIRERRTGLVYAGDQARDLLGLRDADERVEPEQNPDYDVFVQSTSVNRKLLRGTDLLLLR